MLSLISLQLRIVVVVVVVVVALCIASNALRVPLRREQVKFLMPIWSCRCSTFGPEESGNEFQTIGAATEYDRRPNLLRRCRGTTSWRRLADRRRWRLETSDVRMQQFTNTAWEHDSGGSDKLWLNSSYVLRLRTGTDVGQAWLKWFWRYFKMSMIFEWFHSRMMHYVVLVNCYASARGIKRCFCLTSVSRLTSVSLTSLSVCRVHQA